MALPKDKLPVLEEFSTIQGEGINLGVPYYFIRVGGCPLRCNHCDSEYTWTLKPDSVVNLQGVIDTAIDTCHARGIEWISITGGEPLLYIEQLKDMMLAFRKAGLKTHIETSGRFHDADVHRMSDIYSVDAKTPCTNEMMEGKLLGKEYLRSCDQVKCLIQNYHDLEYAYELNQELDGKCTMVLQPFNTYEQVDNITQVRSGVGAAFKNMLYEYHRSVEEGNAWKKVVLTPQVHVLAYGNTPGT